MVHVQIDLAQSLVRNDVTLLTAFKSAQPVVQFRRLHAMTLIRCEHIYAPYNRIYRVL